MSSVDPDNAVDYARRLHDRILNWYKNADSKAQVLLTLDGVFCFSHGRYIH
jgi:hypothetical protein